jgi:capsular exopolysaccharide synthesis family protein
VTSIVRSMLRGSLRRRETGENAWHLITSSDPNSAASEAYRELHMNLASMAEDNPPRVIALTSPGLDEARSKICANLGVTLAQAYESTLLMDCDFYRPTIHKYFFLTNSEGVADVLMGTQSLQEVYKEPMAHLKVVPAGFIPPNRAELVRPQRLSSLFASLRKDFDHVLMTTAPLSMTVDAAIFAASADGVLLVVDAEKSRREDLRQAIQRLERVGGNILGTVVNNV